MVDDFRVEYRRATDQEVLDYTNSKSLYNSANNTDTPQTPTNGVVDNLNNTLGRDSVAYIDSIAASVDITFQVFQLSGGDLDFTTTSNNVSIVYLGDVN